MVTFSNCLRGGRHLAGRRFSILLSLPSPNSNFRTARQALEEHQPGRKTPNRPTAATLSGFRQIPPTIELTAVNQYFLHVRIYRNWGLLALGKHEYEESIEEMHHADKLIDKTGLQNYLQSAMGALEEGN